MAAPASGASQKAHSCAGAPLPLKNATAVDRAGLIDGVGDGDRDQADRGQGQADRQTGKTLGGAVIGGTEDDQEEHRGQDRLGEQRGGQRIPAGGVFVDVVHLEGFTPVADGGVVVADQR